MQFRDKAVDMHAPMKIAEIPQAKLRDKVVYMHGPMKTAEISQVRFPEKVVDMPVVMQQKVPKVLRGQKTMKAPQAQFEEEADDVVMTQRQVWRGQQDTKALKVQFWGKERNRPRTFPCRSFLNASSSKSKLQLPRVKNPAAQSESFMVESLGNLTSHKKANKSGCSSHAPPIKSWTCPCCPSSTGLPELEEAAIRARIPQEMLETILELRATGSAIRVSLR